MFSWMEHQAAQVDFAEGLHVLRSRAFYQPSAQPHWTEGLILHFAAKTQSANKFDLFCLNDFLFFFFFNILSLKRDIISYELGSMQPDIQRRPTLTPSCAPVPSHYRASGAKTCLSKSQRIPWIDLPQLASPGLRDGLLSPLSLIQDSSKQVFCRCMQM